MRTIQFIKARQKVICLRKNLNYIDSKGESFSPGSTAEKLTHAVF